MLFLVIVDNDPCQLYKQLCATVGSTAIGELLSDVDDTNCEMFYKKYLRDFLRLAHKCKHKNQDDETQEYEV